MPGSRTAGLVVAVGVGSAPVDAGAATGLAGGVWRAGMKLPPTSPTAPAGPVRVEVSGLLRPVCDVIHQMPTKAATTKTAKPPLFHIDHDLPETGEGAAWAGA